MLVLLLPTFYNNLLKHYISIRQVEPRQPWHLQVATRDARSGYFANQLTETPNRLVITPVHIMTDLSNVTK